MQLFRVVIFCLTISSLFFSVARASAEETVDFGQQVRPLLSDRCFACHGPDKAERHGGFRLDQKASAFGSGDSGEPLIVPGDPEQSELFRRITSEDESLRMPPADGHAHLTADQIELIRRWIAEGASWEEHWSYQPLVRPDVPEVAGVDHAVDAFIQDRLKREQLKPAAAADPATLLRRVTLDLTGLPPTPAELDQFLADPSEAAYSAAVDRLLASARYGEHMARYWLDAARYGDTHGLHLDNYREMWPYRDWVIQAFNENMPFDQFVREQLAGDLLENPTREQLIATGFNRCNVSTSEGGSIAEEVYVRNNVDRVVTYGTVFLGATFDCTRCHDHKFDPYTQADFYSMFAFFNSIDGPPLDGNREDHAPVLQVPNEEQASRLKELDEQLAELGKQRKAMQPRIDALQQKWEQQLTAEQSSRTDAENWLILTPEAFRSTGGSELKLLDDQSLLASGKNPAQDNYEIIASLPAGTDWQTIRLEGLVHPSLTEGGAGRSSNSNVVLTEVLLEVATAESPDVWQPLEIQAGWADHEQTNGDFKIENAFDGQPQTGWAIEGFKRRENREARFITKQPFGGQEPIQIRITLKHESVYGQHQFGRVRLSAHAGRVIPNTVPVDVLKFVELPADKRDKKQQQRIDDYFLSDVLEDGEFSAWKKEQDEATVARKKLNEEIPTSMIFRETKEPKAAFVLNRGEYDQKGEEVQRQTPAVLHGYRSEWPMNRLGLAEWTVSRENPLTARVTVNRFWQQLFGVGLVKTSEDFGSQGERPSHPKLLDWLAVDFVEHDWNVKRFMKQLVMSNTYRQSSALNEDLLRKDPENRLLARGPRYRLDAEILRDQALFLSGLLVEQQGGPSVKPPQPGGLWEAVGYTNSNTARFKADEGATKVHRRTLYTFIKRTSPPPQMTTFDGPSREFSCVRRERTNTPMQVLLLFNDPQYLDAARSLAERGMQHGGQNPEQIVGWLYRLCSAQAPDEVSLQTLTEGFKRDRELFVANPDRARQLLAACQLTSQDDQELSDQEAAEWAAWTVTANILLSMDVTLNKN